MLNKTVSHYRIRSQLGEGGMGKVFQAEDLKLRRPVALKFLSSELVPDTNARKRLLQEARLASRLNHPNIATIYEVDESEDAPYIAMELVEGESLRDTIRHGALPISKTIEIARQVGEALEQAHRAGVLHRDIKPGNVMVTADGQVKVLDFGLAMLTGHEKGLDEDEQDFLSRTATHHTTSGTVPYMAPEVLRGEKPDERTDIFAFGVLLYECLTAKRPFEGKSPLDVCLSILQSAPAPLVDLAPESAPAWQPFLDRCLAKDNTQRFQSMRELLVALGRLAGEPAPEKKKSIAVLYFENMSESKDDAYFRDGMTEDIITEIAKIRERRIFPRTSVLSYRDELLTAQQVGRNLSADYVVEGSLRRASDRLRITARLVETRTGHSVWAERYDRQMADVFAIQEEIANSIATALRVVLTDEEKRHIEKVPTANVAAYDFFLRGMQYFHQFRRQSFELAENMFERAILIDRNYARAYAGVADCCSQLHTWWRADERYSTKAEQASRRALELDPELAEAHASRGLAVSLTKDYEEAEREFQTAIQLKPDLFEAHFFYGRLCWALGRMEEAVERFNEAARIRPEDYQAPAYLASLLAGLAHPTEAEAANRRCLEVINKHLRLHPEDARAINMGAIAWSYLGESEKALEWAERALEMDPDEINTLYNAGCVYALLGRLDAAIDCLERAVQLGFGHKDWIDHDADLNALRSHPRFLALIAQLAEAP